MRFVTTILLLTTCLCLPARALLYRAPEGTLKDNCVVWHDGTYYVFTMYRNTLEGGEEQWRHVWLATSQDGVHWQDVGPVIQDAPWTIYAMRVWRAGDRWVMNHGSFTDGRQDVLRFWESPDLVHWTYLGPDYDVRRPDGERIDHMNVLIEERDGKTEYYGYAVGGMLRSDDGVKWTWVADYPFTDDLRVRVVSEPGGCERIGDTYYLLVGGFFPGSFGYAVGTFTSANPMGPFAPDYPAFRLNGYSDRSLVALWACFFRQADNILLSNYILDPGGRFWWHAPLKSSVVDAAGHLRMGYWNGNEALKGEEVPVDISLVQTSISDASPVPVADGQITLTAAPQPVTHWITPGAPVLAAATLAERFDVQQGFVLEGDLRVDAIHYLVFPAAGIYVEDGENQGVAALFGTWEETHLGRLNLSDSVRFTCEDETGYGCATVAGMPQGTTCRFRLLFRQNILELYLDDLLVQTYSTRNATGRVGLVVQDGTAVFGRIQAWRMSL